MMSLLNFQSDTKNKLQSPVETGVSVRGMGKENVERDKNMAYTCTQDAAIGWKRILSKKKTLLPMFLSIKLQVHWTNNRI